MHKQKQGSSARNLHNSGSCEQRVSDSYTACQHMCKVCSQAEPGKMTANLLCNAAADFSNYQKFILGIVAAYLLLMLLAWAKAYAGASSS